MRGSFLVKRGRKNVKKPSNKQLKLSMINERRNTRNQENCVTLTG